MRLTIIIFSIVFISLQTATSILWVQTKAIEQFRSAFLAFYSSGIPMWSDLAFSLGDWWFLPSFIALAFLVFGSIFNKTYSVTILALVISGLSFFGMLYAMYPVDLMLTDVMF
ncbi:hypothetical protein [Agarivorans sp. 1_MG-2023]|uniref:hypothetical protein n=1 Tax=unclassified Agarivorans TaxID=2636026 RepID=UPI0026E49083|nr:hypothetical protein [Agarivorans sp. 1_MG-2023]MDO6765768.1 hypothetical protein [Agarivorans sp. 1_MG-2023]